MEAGEVAAALDLGNRERERQELNHGEKDGDIILRGLAEEEARKPSVLRLEPSVGPRAFQKGRVRAEWPSQGLGCQSGSLLASAHWIPGGEGCQSYTVEVSSKLRR